MHIHEIISPQRITCSMPASSKKRLLEKISALLGGDESGLDENAAFQSLFDRERLGSTGVGDGVALPHGRLRGLKQAIGAFATLEQEMDYDAIDHKPVQMVFALLVPEDATEEHLQLLAELAKTFSNEQTRERLLRATNNDEIYNCLREVGSKQPHAP